MGDKLPPGTKVAFKSGRACLILDWLAEGTQGHVYRAVLDGDRVCLKIWKGNGATTPQQRSHLVRYAAQGRPTTTFVKVLDVVPSQDGGAPVGYAMELVDLSQVEGIEGLLAYTPLPPMSHLVDLAILLVLSLRRLHARGLAYRDLSLANVRFDFKRRVWVVFLDPDNITPDGAEYPIGIRGTLGCLAPEIITKGAPPSQLTDLYGVAVLLFQLLMGGMHPLYGRNHLRFQVDGEKTRLFMEAHRPVFVFDPACDANRPDEVAHGRLIYCWTGLPHFMQQLFTRAFTAGIVHPEQRIRESTWLTALLTLRGLIDACPQCGEERFVEPNGSKAGSKSALCRQCQTEFAVGARLVASTGSEIVLRPGVTIRSSQLKADTLHRGTDCTIATVAAVGMGKRRLALRNTSNAPWTLQKKDRRSRPLLPSRAVVLDPETEIHFDATPTVGVVKPSL